MRSFLLATLQKMDGYIAVPHELMHVVAYRLIGKQCAYRLGDRAVIAPTTCTLRERIFCLLFPLLVNGLATIGLLGLWVMTYITANYPANPLLYFEQAPVWHRSLLFAWFILLTYMGMAVLDVVIVIRLLLQKMRQQPPNDTQKYQAERQSP